MFIDIVLPAARILRGHFFRSIEGLRYFSVHMAVYDVYIYIYNPMLSPSFYVVYGLPLFSYQLFW